MRLSWFSAHQKMPASFVACGAFAALLTGCLVPADQVASSPQIQRPFAAVLQAQADAWNRGDIDGFMAHYWKSDDLTFSSGGETRRGWMATRDRFRTRYPTPERMGHLTFDNLETFPLNGDAALVLGRWHLRREPDSIGGNFSLIFRRIAGAWRIIHDHTSVLPPPDAPKQP